MSHILDFKKWFKIYESTGMNPDKVRLILEEGEGAEEKGTGGLARKQFDPNSTESQLAAMRIDATNKMSQFVSNREREKMRASMKEEEEEYLNRFFKPLMEYSGGQKVGKNINNLRANAQLQAMLKHLGLLESKAGPLGNGITCYFNGETEEALRKFSGTDYVDFSDAANFDALKNAMIAGDSLYTRGINEEIAKLRDEAIAAKQLEIMPFIDAGLMKSRYEYVGWQEGGGLDYQLALTGDILQDMFLYNSLKEGGLADDPRDKGPAQTPCPYEFDAKTGILNYKGQNIKLNINPHLQNSVSVMNGGSKSSKWHTSRGVIWPTWKSAAALMGITNELDVVKAFFEMTDENARKVYEVSFYDQMIKNKGRETLSPLVNHCLGTAFWGSIVHGEKTITNSLAQLSEYGYSSFNDAIEKVGDKFVTEVVLDNQSKLYLSYSNAGTYGKGWIRGMVNFHRYFVPYHADFPPKEKFPQEYEKRKQLKQSGFANLLTAPGAAV